MTRFSVDEYLKNPSRKIVTGDGRPVKVIFTSRGGSHSNYPVIVLVGKDQAIEEYTADGRYYPEQDSPDEDLFFAPTTYEGYCVIILCGNSPYILTGIFNTVEEAENAGRGAIYNAAGDGFCVNKLVWER